MPPQKDEPAEAAAASESPSVPAADAVPPPRFSPEEEATLLAESTSHKTAANALFAASQYRDAMDRYFEAIDVCPNYLDYELAVLKSNISACQIKLQEWKDAMKSATEALDGLDRLEGKGKETEVPEGKDKGKQKEGQESGDAEVEAAPKKHEEEDEEVEEEIISSGAAKAGPALPKPSEEPPSYAASEAAQKRADDVRRIRAKALMRRGRARVELGGWANLAGAGEDYALLASMDNLGAADRRAVLYQLRDLPAKTSAAKEAEMAEMWGKLKDLGNGLLKPFGLTTDSFKMAQDEKTGGYSMNFQNSGGK